MSDGMNVCNPIAHSANPIKRQVGGDHYMKMGIQPWEIIDANRLDFYEGTALSYLLRWKEKNGVQDLQKAIHTIEKMIKREEDDKMIKAYDGATAIIWGDKANEDGSNKKARCLVGEASEAAIRG